MNNLNNKNINLRALEPSDLELLYQWENNMEIWEVSNTLAPFSRYVLKQYLENAHQDNFEAKQLRLVIELTSKQTPIGLIDLFDYDPFHQRAGIGILIHNPSDRSKGLASEALETFCNYAFEVLCLHQLYCNITSDNLSSIKLFKNAGFQTAGIKKEWIKNPKGYTDEILLQRFNPYY